MRQKVHFGNCKYINVYAGLYDRKKEDTVKSYLLSYIINLMNHKNIGFGISEEEETIVSMCTVSIVSACGFCSWCEWEHGHKIHLK